MPQVPWETFPRFDTFGPSRWKCCTREAAGSFRVAADQCFHLDRQKRDESEARGFDDRRPIVNGVRVRVQRSAGQPLSSGFFGSAVIRSSAQWWPLSG
jgi:hypothetical protein